MNKFTYALLSLLFFLPVNIMAQEEITIIENGDCLEITGTVITISEDEEYIDTDTKLYNVKEKNTTMLGDVVKNNMINIHDVTAIVDIILNNDFAPDSETNKYKFEEYNHAVANVNEDDNINIQDVTDEVDVVLGVIPPKQYVESYVVEDITGTWIKSNTATAVDQH